MFKKTVLDNGVRILSESANYLNSLSLGIWVDAGSRDETLEENGVSHFIEHMVFKGTRNRSALQIAKELDAIGGLSNAFTGKENTCFHARVLGKHFCTLSDILSDLFLNPIFDLADIEREREVILQEISMVEDTPDENVHVLFNRHFWRDHPIGMPILGTGKSILAIKRDHLFSYRARHYSPDRVLIVAAGNVDHEKLVSFFRPLFEPLEPNGHIHQRQTPNCYTGVSVYTKELEQVHICIGGEAPSLRSPERFACGVFNTILGGNMSSRLFQEIRENRGLAYSVFSFLSAYLDTGMLGIYVATDKDKVNHVLDTLKKEVRKMLSGGITEDDLSFAREHLIGGIYLAADNTDNRMMRIAKNEMVYGRYISYEELVAELNKVTLNDVIKAGRKVFLDNGISMTALGPIGEEEIDKGCIEFS
ncbi:MAG: insulinase family protein [Deltaproteobacteria bacterium]|nr:insulinase family protein [Deltaproteobacteria bacterium]MBW2081520.1 insulinase family protein [Deltaproteobacteria bacterium]HDM10467.1 insulinase family protein [Desulfobacteraceae bacterium]